ncbi:MAG: MaoC family dehydratase [Chitinophagales bacterium]
MGPALEHVKNLRHPGTLAYNWFFYTRAIKGVLRKHRVKSYRPRFGRDDHLVIYPESKRRWYELFQVPEEIEVPFTYHDHARAVGLMILIEGLGVNFRYLLHLKSELRFHKYLVPGEVYVADYLFADVVRIRKDKAAIVGYTTIKKDGELYLESRDHFVIKNVPEKYLMLLKSDESGEFKGLTHVPPEPLVDNQVKEIYIPGDLPRKYGATSGDKNFVHTSAWVARQFGYNQPFIQGLCTANLIMKELCTAGVSLDHFSITFCRPVFLRTTVFLHYTDNVYRLLDEAGNVLCFGRINSLDGNLVINTPLYQQCFKGK